METDRDQTAIDTLRFLAVDMVEAAQSGHPGAPMGQAPMAFVLWSRFLRFDPDRPDWPDRDRFVLSCGHASALLYGLLHLAGFDLPIEELRQFRQLGSQTPGHPENFLTPGVETTTGPLGQGFGNAVGMALAREKLAERYSLEDGPLFDHRIWVLASDGDLMEGVASEAASLAGHLELGCLNVLYDSNRITIDGATDLTFSENVPGRFEAYGWHTEEVTDGNDLGAIDAALEAAAREDGRPSLILVRTHIGYGSPNKQDTASAHGAPLGADEVRRTKEALGWPPEETFRVPKEARMAFAPARKRGSGLADRWEERLTRFRKEIPDRSRELERRLARELPAAWDEDLPSFEVGSSLATRKASGAVLQSVAGPLPELVGGSADLSGSNKTLINDGGDFSARNRGGRNLRFGVREHAMGAILNGMALSGLFRPYGGTFLIFSDYLRPTIRLAALMGLPVLYVFTHDSIFLGEDGPTHQPISQLPGLRAIPGLVTLRPADAWETRAAWRIALTRTRGPTALCLTRQKIPVLAETGERADGGVAHGGYVLADAPGGEPDLILLATGSEVWVCLEARRRLAEEGVGTRVVSLPSWELFEEQDREYRERVLPRGVTRRLAVEAAAPLGWERYTGPGGAIHGQDGFGASAPWEDLAQRFGFTPEAVAEAARRLLG
ncbi:MAG: transketolase [Thermoanaerobaculia bacterium]|nr:transketolase [Thermoanaerobaculia bacterium]